MTTLRDFSPWPIEDVVKCLSRDALLRSIVAPRSPGAKRDVREHLLEDAVTEVCVARYGRQNVFSRKPIGRILGVDPARWPARCLPDITLRCDGAIHVCEVKSSRTDYPRFDDVLDSKAFREHLTSAGHRGPAPWEVEQDLIKLRKFGDLSPSVQTGLLLFLDAFADLDRSWTRAFKDPSALRGILRTEIAQGWGDALCASALVVPLRAPGAEARLLLCLAHRSACSRATA